MLNGSADVARRRETESSSALSIPSASGAAVRTPRELHGAVAGLLRCLNLQEPRFEIYVRDRGGTLAPVVRTGTGHRREGDLLASLVRCAPTRQSLFTDPLVVPADPNARRTGLMSVPLLDATARLIGILVVEAALDDHDSMRSRILALQGIAALLSHAVRQVYPEEAAHARAALDWEAAPGAQLRLMSKRLPPKCGVTAHTGYIPALGVGGDFYSLDHIDDGRITVAIGDVSGNGLTAALLMSRVAFEIERSLGTGQAPSAVLQAINQRLSEIETDTFVTACCVQLDPRSRMLTVSNAGHLPLVVRRASGEVFTCGGASGTPLGILPCEYEDEEVTLGPADILLLMTDGLVEAFDDSAGMKGMERVLGLVRESPHDAGVVDHRIRAAVETARAAHALDDVTWVGLQLAG